jgi:hypothetical protein
LDGAPAVACGSSGVGALKLVPVNNGSHTIVINAFDASGNVTTKSTSYSVHDSTAPRLHIDDAFDGMSVGASVTTHPEAEGASLIECAVDTAPYTACLSTGWTASFTSTGAHALKYRATDPAGNSVEKSVTVTATAAVPAPPAPPADPGTPAPPAPITPTLPAAKAAFAAIKPKVTKKTVSIPLSVSVTFPGGVSIAKACSGKATLVLTVGKKKLKSASAPLKLKKNKCTVASTLKLKTAQIAGKKFTVAITFDGNATIGQFYSSKAGKSGKFKK